MYFWFDPRRIRLALEVARRQKRPADHLTVAGDFVRVLPAMTNHYIVLARRGFERKAFEQLAFFGAPVYFPLIAVIRTSRRHPNAHAVLLPAFPGYGFCEASTKVFEALQCVSLCYGVMIMNGAPVELSQDEIDRLKTAEQAWRKTPIILKGRLLPGQIVRITSGVLTGFLATVLSSEPHTTRISINAPGRCSAKISVPTRVLLDEALALP